MALKLLFDTVVGYTTNTTIFILLQLLQTLTNL